MCGVFDVVVFVGRGGTAYRSQQKCMSCNICNKHKPLPSFHTRTYIIQYIIMKFSAAVIVAVMASSVHGFVPATSSSAKNMVLSMATETPTKMYTFTKSEEIFAEAQTVCSLLIGILLTTSCSIWCKKLIDIFLCSF